MSRLFAAYGIRKSIRRAMIAGVRCTENRTPHFLHLSGMRKKTAKIQRRTRPCSGRTLLMASQCGQSPSIIVSIVHYQCGKDNGQAVGEYSRSEILLKFVCGVEYVFLPPGWGICNSVSESSLQNSRFVCGSEGIIWPSFGWQFWGARDAAITGMGWTRSGRSSRTVRLWR